MIYLSEDNVASHADVLRTSQRIRTRDEALRTTAWEPKDNVNGQESKDGLLT